MGDFLRIGVAAQGYAPLSKNCFVLFLDMLGHASSNSARADAVDGDALPPQFYRKGARQTNHAVFSRGIGTCFRSSTQTLRRCDIDDASTFAFTKMRQRSTNSAGMGPQQNIQMPIPDLFVIVIVDQGMFCLLYTSPSPRDRG